MDFLQQGPEGKHPFAVLMVEICSCVLALLRVALLLLEGCLELQSELAVSILPMADNLPPCEDSGIPLGVKKRAVYKTKNRNAEGSSCSFDNISAVCQLKAENPKWGKRKVGAHLQGEQSRNIPISTIQRYYDTFLFDIEQSCLFQLYRLLTDLCHELIYLFHFFDHLWL